MKQKDPIKKLFISPLSSAARTWSFETEAVATVKLNNFEAFEERRPAWPFAGRHFVTKWLLMLPATTLHESGSSDGVYHHPCVV